MKAIYSAKQNIYLPCGWDFEKSQRENKKNFECFERGKGQVKHKTKDFVEVEIPNLNDISLFVVKEYSDKYGEEITRNELNKHMAGVCAEKHLPKCQNFPVSKSFYEEFNKTIQSNLFDFGNWMVGIFGIWSFDLPEFDDFCHRELAYKEEEHGSLNDFLLKKFGAGFVERFRVELINKS